MNQLSDKASSTRTAGRVALALAAVGGVLSYLAYRIFRADNEPPIRVKNGGSMLVELVTSRRDVKWVDPTNGEWSHNGGHSPGPVFWVKLVAGVDWTSDMPSGGAAVKRVVVTANNNEQLHFRQDNDCLPRLKPQRDLTRKSATVLTNMGGAGQHIAKVDLYKGDILEDPEWTCTFKNEHELVELLLCPRQHQCKKS